MQLWVRAIFVQFSYSSGRSLLMFAVENALLTVLSQAARYLRDAGIDSRVKQLLKRELGSELVSGFSKKTT